MILQYTLCTAAIKNPFYLPWFCQDIFATDPLYPQRRPLVAVVCLCCSPWPCHYFPWGAREFRSFQVQLCPTYSSCFREHPCPFRVSPFKRKPKKVDTFCAQSSLLTWIIRRLGLQGTLWSAFCLQYRSSIFGLSPNLRFIEVGELFLCSPKKIREGMRKIAESSSIATDQSGYCGRGLFHSSPAR